MAEGICAEREPPPTALTPGHEAACHAVIPGSGHSAAPRIAA
jgi:peptide/nickel transport system ATP-binding protein